MRLAGLLALLVLVGLTACDGRPRQARARSGAASAASSASAASAPRTGPLDLMEVRFVDRLATVQARTPDLRAAYGKLAWHWQKMPDPWAVLKGDRAYSHVDVAFFRRDIKGYPGPVPKGQKAAAGDRTWNKGIGVYDSRTSIFAPPPADYGFAFSVPKGGAYLRFGHAWLAAPGQPPGAALEFVVEAREPAGTKALYSRAVLPSEANEWIEAEVDLAPLAGREVTLGFVTRGAGRATGAGFWGDPLLYRRGGTGGLNVVVILVDTLRCEAVGACGGPFGLTPQIDAVARTGVTFRKAFANATWTRPSTVAFLGGNYPSALAATAVNYKQRPEQPPKFYRARPELITRTLRDRGYQVEFIGNNFFILGYAAIGLDLGYERVVDIRHSVLDTPAITRAAEQWLERNRTHQFFLMVHYDTAHIPWDPPPEYLARVKPVPGRRLLPGEKSYLGEIAYGDDHVGKVVRALERLGLRERTLVVVLGDHGETMSPAHAYRIADINLPTLFFHGWTAYDETLQVPLIFSLPGRIPAGRHSDEVVRLMDLAPTVLDLLGEKPARPMYARSLTQLLQGQPDPPERPVFVEGHGVRALRVGNLKYIKRDFGTMVQRGGVTRAIPEELYDVAADPGETRNLVGSAPAKLKLMRELFRAEPQNATKGPAGAAPASGPAPTPSTTYRLRLGADDQPRLLKGRIRAVGATVAVTGIHGAARAVPSPDAVEIEIAARENLNGVDFEVEPPWAELELDLALDGKPLDAKALRLGRFGLSLTENPRKLGRGDLPFLDSSTPPLSYAGLEVAVYLWRSPVVGGEGAAEAGADSDASRGEVENLLRRWGYAQGKK
ncbi:MAG: sulfatase [Deltaproteobacteria bacterium]|nr:sulfatase [Deltaproteobacteria bacterium]